MKHNSTIWRFTAAFIVIAVLYLFPTWTGGNQYMLHVAIMCGLGAVFGLGFRIVYLANRLSLGQSLFTAFGAYFSALLAMRLGLSFWLTLPLSGIAAACLAAIIGWPSLRLKGAYFAVFTFGLSEVMTLFITNWQAVTEGARGLPLIPAPNTITIWGFKILEFTILDKTPYYYLVLSLLIITALTMYRVDKSILGLIVKAIGQSDSLAESVGINVTKYQVAAFSMGCFFTGAGGACLAHYLGCIQPADFNFWASVDYLIYAFVGGMSSVFGPILGAVLFVVLSNILTGFAKYYLLIHGLTLIVVVFFFPEGVIALTRYLHHVPGFKKIRSKFEAPE